MGSLIPRDGGKFLKGFHYSPKTEFTSERTRERNRLHPFGGNRETVEKARMTKRGKHYSPKTEFKKGYVPINPIRKGEHRGKNTEFQGGGTPVNAIRKGEHLSPQTEFKKGRIPWNKGRKNCWSEKMLKRILTRREPNKEESCLIDLFNEYNLPYKFVGNGQVIIGGKNPDFININGRKTVIEFFGEHWHSLKDEQEKRVIYNSYGFAMLSIWGIELKNLGKVVSKILKFEKGDRQCLTEQKTVLEKG